ncbi:DUF397 domain-containing protein [Streptomyces sp. NPDC002835]|jgi:hypothetical protein
MQAAIWANATWRKSSYSGGGSSGGDCVEVAGLTGRAAVRDSKNAPAPYWPSAAPPGTRSSPA